MTNIELYECITNNNDLYNKTVELPLLLLLLLFPEPDESLRRKSSLRRDFNGETLINDGSGRLLDVAPFSSVPLLFGSCLIGISEIEGVIVSSFPPRLL